MAAGILHIADRGALDLQDPVCRHLPDCPAGWQPIGTALVRMHEHPERNWDGETLAAEAGMSRSSFAQRFVELVGEPPSKYLTRWRMQVAARLLQTPGVKVAKIAEQVGYGSEAAFSRVFKRYTRMSPSVFRDRGPRSSAA